MVIDFEKEKAIVNKICLANIKWVMVRHSPFSETFIENR